VAFTALGYPWWVAVRSTDDRTLGQHPGEEAIARTAPPGLVVDRVLDIFFVEEQMGRIHSVVAAVVLITATSVVAQSDIRPNDRLVLNKSSVFIYRSPGGGDDGEVTRQDLRSNGDVIIAQEVREFRGQEWVKVRITSGKQEGVRFKMPDTIGWFKAADVTKSASARPYGAPKDWLQRLQTTIGVQRVVDAAPFVIELKPGFWSGLSSAQQRQIAEGHFKTVWPNRPRAGSIQIKDAGVIVAESDGPGKASLR
jgi:hypothetical protein